MPQSVVVATGSIRDYFRLIIDDALAHQTLNPGEDTLSYIVDLLAEYARAHRSDLDEPLAPVLASAARCPPQQSVPRLKKVGDQSLYLSGFFAESLRRRHLDRGYYVVLGRIAYGRLSRVLRRSGDRPRLVVVYGELRREFASFARLLTDARELTAAGAGGDLGELYQRWRETGSNVVARRLRSEGMTRLDPEGDDQ